MPEHEHHHTFTPVTGRTHTDGTPIPGVRRCPCGIEVVGTGPYAHDFNTAVADAVATLAATLRR